MAMLIIDSSPHVTALLCSPLYVSVCEFLMVQKNAEEVCRSSGANEDEERQLALLISTCIYSGYSQPYIMQQYVCK